MSPARPETLRISMDAWQIADGLYSDLYRGDELRLSVHARIMTIERPEAPSATELTCVGGCLYRIIGSVAAVGEGHWTLDAGLPLFVASEPPAGLACGDEVVAMALLGAAGHDYAEVAARGISLDTFSMTVRIDAIHQDTRRMRALRLLENRPILPGQMLPPINSYAAAGGEECIPELDHTDSFFDDGGGASYLLTVSILDEQD